MELQGRSSHFTYRIEPKPGGGFIAHAADPSVAPLEAPTREELQEKIKETILPALAAQFPGLKLPLEDQDPHCAFHIERKPEGGFVIHSSDPNAEAVEVPTYNDVERYIAGKVPGLVGKDLAPGLSQALAEQANSAEIKVLVNRRTGVTLHAGAHSWTLGLGRNPKAPASASNPTTEMEPAIANSADAISVSPGETATDIPIQPETSRDGKVFVFLLLALVAAALVYFFLQHR